MNIQREQLMAVILWGKTKDDKLTRLHIWVRIVIVFKSFHLMYDIPKESINPSGNVWTQEYLQEISICIWLFILTSNLHCKFSPLLFYPLNPFLLLVFLSNIILNFNINLDVKSSFINVAQGFNILNTLKYYVYIG